MLEHFEVLEFKKKIQGLKVLEKLINFDNGFTL